MADNTIVTIGFSLSFFDNIKFFICYENQVYHISYVSNMSHGTNMNYVNNMTHVHNMSYVNNTSCVNNMDYVNNMSYVSYMIYVNDMSYVNYMSIFMDHLKSNNFFHNI